MGSKGSNTTTQKTAPDPAAMAAYQDLLNRAHGVASTPYNPYTGNLTAGVNAQQNLGIAGINNATQAGNPWFQYAASMAHPLSTSDIQNYQNPYTQNVVDATQAQFDRSNAQQQEGLKARAAAQGALGGSRANIAAADMAYQQQLGQAPVIAGLYNQSYNQALAAAQQQQQAGFQGAGVGANIQQAGLQGAGAQIGAGTLQQQTAQNELNALYQQYQLAQSFPYQQTQWLAGLDTGVGSQMGGTSTTTAPAPSLFGQIAGAGVAGLGLAGGLGWKPFAAKGGRIEGYDAGGSVGAEPYGGVGFIPHMQITRGSGPPRPPEAPQQQKLSFDPSKFAFPRQSGVAGPVQLDPYATAGAGVGQINPTAPQPDIDPNGQNFYARGGVAGYQAGGSPLAPMDDDSEYDPGEGGYEQPTRAGVGVASPASYEGGIFGGLGFRPVDFPASASAYAAADRPVAYATPDTPSPQRVPMPRPRPAELAPVYDDRLAGVGAAPPAPQPRSGGFDWSSLSMPLMAAGFGMMASRSPHPGVAIGEGALAGVGAYAEQKREQAAQNLAEKKQALDAQRLQQMADQARAVLQERTRANDIREKQVNDLSDWRNDRLNQESLRPTGAMTEDNHPILYDSRRPGVAIDGVTGEPIKPGQKVINPKNDVGASIPEEHKNLHGDEYLETLPAGDSAFVKGLAEYSIDPKTLSTRGGQREKYLKMALQYDPSFRQQRYNEIYNAQTRFSTGKQGDTVRSFNVAIHHLGTLEEAAKALGNRDMQAWNRLGNAIQTQMGYEAPNTFEAVRDIVSNEMVKAIIGSGGGVGDREEAHKRISAANSPAQLDAVIKYYKKLMAGQMLGLKKQYEDATGLKNFNSKLMPETIRQLGIAAGHGDAAPASTPKRVKQNGHTYEQQPDGSYKAID